ncbi:MAG TPA: hypothetical protein VGE01_07460, partial [Fimbriimonas sp.]
MPLLSVLIASAALTQAPPVEVPFRTTADAMFVDTTVNGVKMTLLFDTGFGGSVVADSGVNLGQPSGKAGLRDFVGQFEAPTVKIKTLSIGARKVDATDMQAIQQPMAS